MKKDKPSPSNKQKPVAKKTKRRKKVVKVVKIIGMDMEQIYTVINATQIQRIEQELIVDPINAPMIENILKDCEITFVKEVKKDGLYYILKPAPQKEILDEDFIYSDEIPDEMIEDGFCF